MASTAPIFVFYRGDVVVFVGSRLECAQYFGMSTKSVDWHASPVAVRRAAEAGPDSKKLYAEKVNLGNE